MTKKKRPANSPSSKQNRHSVDFKVRAVELYVRDGYTADAVAEELGIKDHKVALMSDRTSCHRKETNQFRLFIHSPAYVRLHALRDNLLRGSELATAQFDTIRLRLLKIGTRIEVGKTFIRFHFPASYPLQPLLCRASTMLAALNTS